MIWLVAYFVFVVSMLSVAMLAGVVMGIVARIEEVDDEPVVDAGLQVLEEYANRSRHPAWPKATYTEPQVRRGQ